jgi:WD40 repeat protein
MDFLQDIFSMLFPRSVKPQTVLRSGMDLLEDYLHGITGLLDHVRDYVGDFEGIAVGQTSGPPCEQILGLPNGRLAIATHGQILIVDPKTGEPCVTLPVDTSNLGMFGDQLVTSSNDWTWRTWDLTTGFCTSERVITRDAKQSLAAYKFCMLNRNQLALFRDMESGVKVMDLTTGVRMYTLDFIRGLPTAAVCLHNGCLVIATQHNLHVYDNGRFVRNLKVQYKASISNLQADGRWLLAQASDGFIRVWDIWTLKCVLTFVDSLHVVLFNDQIVAVRGTNRKQMDMYRLPSDQEPYKSLQSESNVTSLATMPNCRLVSSHADGSLRFWR